MKAVELQQSGWMKIVLSIAGMWSSMPELFQGNQVTAFVLSVYFCCFSVTYWYIPTSNSIDEQLIFIYVNPAISYINCLLILVLMYIFVCVVCDAPHSSAPHYGTLSPLHRCAPQQDWQSPGLGKIVGLQYLNRLSHRAMEKVDHLIVHLHPVDNAPGPSQ